MILPAKTVRAVAAGRATQVRVPMRDRCPVKIGRDIPIRQHGKPALCRAKAVKATTQALGDVTHAEARAMDKDHRTLQAWREDWLRQHDAAWVTAHADSLGVLEGAAIDARFASRWADVTVWAITLQLVADPPRFLAAGKGSVDAEGNGDYTLIPARGLDREAGEAVDAAWQQRRSDEALSFCIGRQLARQKERTQQRTERKAERHPAPWKAAA